MRRGPGRRDSPGAARSRGRRGVRKAPIFFTTFARLRQKKTRPRNGTRDAPQLRQPLPRRRPAVHVQHEVDDCDVMTDLGRLPHRSTRFPRPRPMEKNNGLTQHASRNSVPALEIGDPGSEKARRQRSPMARRDWSANCVWKCSIKKVHKNTVVLFPLFNDGKRVRFRDDLSWRPTGTAGRFGHLHFAAMAARKDSYEQLLNEVGWMARAERWRSGGRDWAARRRRIRRCRAAEVEISSFSNAFGRAATLNSSTTRRPRSGRTKKGAAPADPHRSPAVRGLTVVSVVIELR